MVDSRVVPHSFRLRPAEEEILHKLVEIRQAKSESAYVRELVLLDASLLLGPEVVFDVKCWKSPQATFAFTPRLRSWPALAQLVGQYVRAARAAGDEVPSWAADLDARGEQLVDEGTSTREAPPGVCCKNPRASNAGFLIFCDTCEAELAPAAAAQICRWRARASQAAGNGPLAREYEAAARAHERAALREETVPELRHTRLRLGRGYREVQDNLANEHTAAEARAIVARSQASEAVLQRCVMALDLAGDKGATEETLIAEVALDEEVELPLGESARGFVLAALLEGERRGLLHLDAGGDRWKVGPRNARAKSERVHASAGSPCGTRHASGLVCDRNAHAPHVGLDAVHEVDIPGTAIRAGWAHDKARLVNLETGDVLGWYTDQFAAKPAARAPESERPARSSCKHAPRRKCVCGAWTCDLKPCLREHEETDCAAPRGFDWPEGTLVAVVTPRCVRAGLERGSVLEYAGPAKGGPPWVRLKCGEDELVFATDELELASRVVYDVDTPDGEFHRVPGDHPAVRSNQGREGWRVRIADMEPHLVEAWLSGYRDIDLEPLATGTRVEIVGGSFAGKRGKIGISEDPNRPCVKVRGEKQLQRIAREHLRPVADDGAAETTGSTPVTTATKAARLAAKKKRASGLASDAPSPSEWVLRCKHQGVNSAVAHTVELHSLKARPWVAVCGVKLQAPTIPGRRAIECKSCVRMRESESSRGARVADLPKVEARWDRVWDRHHDVAHTRRKERGSADFAVCNVHLGDWDTTTWRPAPDTTPDCATCAASREGKETRGAERAEGAAA
ncbi:hypothetical protein [Polyangium sp. 15x6]|uniref:hypothetical protein n=1 Tax=Polyangium sp. 15x6 TaxID=3042687 RepID=UPI00249CC408|nr:hypothetical protein [Polyangium sp. 15x6]MDI3285176.1 hypothetical protein [Polyangium sp. 15x6]